MARTLDNIVIDNAEIGFRNFSGKEGKFNAEGNRNFALFLEQDLAEVLEKDGWNVRWLEPKFEDVERKALLSVKVAFGAYPPKIVLIANGKKSELDESTVHILDWADIKMVDLSVRPYVWNIQGKEGVKGYLKTMYVTLAVDDFESKYEVVPNSATDSIGGCGACDICTAGTESAARECKNTEADLSQF